LARLLRDAKAGILLSEHIAKMGRACSPMCAGLASRASSPSA
jgi:hypothetical protein